MGINLREFENSPGIYSIEDADGNFYIGSSKRIRHRLSEHMKRLQNRKHHNSRLQSSFDNIRPLKAALLLVCREQDLLFYEQLLIDNLRPGLNLSREAGKVSPEILRESMQRRWLDPKQRAAMILSSGTAFKGKRHTEEERRKMSIAVRKAQDETDYRARLSVSKLGNKNRLGIKHTDEVKKRISETLKRRAAADDRWGFKANFPKRNSSGPLDEH